MAISTVVQSGSASAPITAIEAQDDSLPIESPTDSASVASSYGTSSFELAQPALVNIGATIELDCRANDSQGRVCSPRPPAGTNDDSITAGDGVERPPLDLSSVPLGQVADIEASTAGLPAETISQVNVLLANPETREETIAVMGSTTFAALPLDQRATMLDVMAKSDAKGVHMMALACEESGDISTLRATNGSTSLDNLARMANNGLGQYVGDIIQDMIRPGAIWQGKAPTCTAASMQYELAKQGPAEYCRVIADLAITGKTMMAGGGVLEVHSGTEMVATMASTNRSATESVFQTALMDFCNGDERYDIKSLASTRADGTTHAGLNGNQIRNGLENLFGIRYATINITSDAQAAGMISALNKAMGPNRPVLVDMIVDDNSNHCVAFEGASNGRVNLRDPATGKPYNLSTEAFSRLLATTHIAAREIPSPVLEKGRTNGIARMMIV